MADQSPSEVFVQYAAEPTEVCRGIYVAVTGIGAFTEGTGAILKVTREPGSLAAMIADLDGYIDRRAQQVAAPVILDAEDAAILKVREARSETARQRDLVTELARRIKPLERLADEARQARDALARALGRNPAGEQLANLADVAAARLRAEGAPDEAH